MDLQNPIPIRVGIILFKICTNPGPRLELVTNIHLPHAACREMEVAIIEVDDTL